MFDVSETLERLKTDREFLTTVLGTIFFLAIFPAYFIIGDSNSDGSLNAIADYKIEGSIEIYELINETEYIFDGDTLQFSLTTEGREDLISKNIVGAQILLSYNEDEEATGPTCVGPTDGQSAADTISTSITHDSYNESGEGTNGGGAGLYFIEISWYNSTLLNSTVSGLSKSQIINELDGQGKGEGEYSIQISVEAESGNSPVIGCERNDEGEDITYSVRLLILDNYTISTELVDETGEV